MARLAQYDATYVLDAVGQALTDGASADRLLPDLRRGQAREGPPVREDGAQRRRRKHVPQDVPGWRLLTPDGLPTAAAGH